MTYTRQVRKGLGCALTVLFLSPMAARAQDFYKDKIIRFIVGQAPGGGYDTYTRLIARNMIRHVPGNPAVTVENMAGAGSLVAANYLYNSSKPDGLTIGNWNSALVLNQALGDKNVKFDARRFGWIGAPTRSVPVCLVMRFTGLQNFAGILKSGRELKMGGTGPGSHSIDMPLLLNKMTGTRFRVVSGYQGTAQIRLALQRREVDGLCTNWDSVLATQRDLLDAKGDEGMIPFIIHAPVAEPEAKNAVLVKDVIRDSGDLQTYRFYMAQMEFSRPLTTSPGTPKERVERLRRAFQGTLGDADFQAEAKALKLDIQHVSGSECEQLVKDVLSIPPKLKENLGYLSSAF